MKEGIHPKYSRRRGALRVRRDLEDPLDQARAAPRNLLELPPVLHRPAEAARHRRPRRAVHEEVRRADVGEPQEGREGDQGQEGSDAGALTHDAAQWSMRSAAARSHARSRRSRPELQTSPNIQSSNCPFSNSLDLAFDPREPMTDRLHRDGRGRRSALPDCPARTVAPSQGRARGARDESRAPRSPRGRSAADSRGFPAALSSNRRLLVLPRAAAARAPARAAPRSGSGRTLRAVSGSARAPVGSWRRRGRPVRRLRPHRRPARADGARVDVAERERLARVAIASGPLRAMCSSRAVERRERQQIEPVVLEHGRERARVAAADELEVARGNLEARARRRARARTPSDLPLERDAANSSSPA